MPPQSRGSPNSPPRGFSAPRAAPPTLGPFLDNLPSPSSTISDQRTPTANGYVGSRPIPSSPTSHQRRPRRTTITNPDRDGGGDGDSDGQDLSDYDANLDDADFQSHYSISAQNSDPGSASPDSNNASSNEEDGEGGEDEVGEEEEGGGGGGGGGGGIISRTTSLSLSPAQPSNYDHLRHSVSAQSLAGPAAAAAAAPLPLFPPFYNRPPTPLPPSPSLTSLLRPPSLLNRSTTSTRPTTPDSSDAETPNDTEAAVAQSARRATVVSRLSPKVPTYEYYGFVLYLASSLAFLLYLLWSYLPSPFLAAIGLHYYPNRWWSLAIPSFLVMLLVYIYVALLSYNVEYLTLPMRSVECMVDEAANIALVDGRGRLRKGGSKMDLRAGGVGNGSWGRNSGGLTPTTMMMTTTTTGGGNNGQRRWGGGGGGGGATMTEKIQWRNLWNQATDAVMDIPIGGVCEVLYGEGRDADADEDEDER